MSSITIRHLAENRSLFAPSAGQKRLDADIGHLLQLLEKRWPQRLETVSVAKARVAPTLTSVLRGLLRDPNDEMGVEMEMRMIPGAAGSLPARIYRPAGVEATGPIVLYLHGGGFVLGSLEGSDPAPRALARRLGSVVVAAHCRQAPEHVFPAAHDDAVAVWRWLVEAARGLGGDAGQMAIVGDGSGGNLALHIAFSAAGARVPGPRHLGLVSPMVGNDRGLSSSVENRTSLPVSSATVEWCLSLYARDARDLSTPQLNPIDRQDLASLPATTVILPEWDPLRTEGELFTQALRRSGVWIDSLVYDGVTHGFFELPAVVNKALFAHSQVARNILASCQRD
jgi:acetyl esterase/lipase